MVIALAFAALAGWWDFRERRIPNLLTYFGMALGIVLGGWGSLTACAACTLALPTLRPHWAFGGGDAKVLGGLASLCPTIGIPVTLLVISSGPAHLGWRVGVNAFQWATCLAFCLELRG
jgi:Flp pilus assembly protein protease CpaA